MIHFHEQILNYQFDCVELDFGWDDRVRLVVVLGAVLLIFKNTLFNMLWKHGRPQISFWTGQKNFQSLIEMSCFVPKISQMSNSWTGQMSSLAHWFGRPCLQNHSWLLIIKDTMIDPCKWKNVKLWTTNQTKQGGKVVVGDVFEGIAELAPLWFHFLRFQVCHLVTENLMGFLWDRLELILR